MDTTENKKIAFKLQSDIEQLKREQSQKDMPFLIEIKERLVKYRDRKDVTQLEMVFNMLDDWIDELKELDN